MLRNKTTRIVRRFNMVEIALALAVLTLGISAILTMIPVGVNSGKKAIAENNLADAANYTLGVYEAYIMSSILRYVDDQGVPHEPTKTLSDWKSALVKPGSDLTYVSSDPGSETNGINWERQTKLVVRGEETNLRRSSDTVLLYEQTTLDADGNESVDFAAVVRVWAEQGALVGLGRRKWESDGSFEGAGMPLRLYAELSWPAGVDWAEREKRVYMMDITDPQQKKVIYSE